MHREYRTVEGILLGNEMGKHGVVDDKRIPVKIIKTYQETPNSCYYKIEIHGEQIKQWLMMEPPYFTTLPTEFKNPVVYKYQGKYHIAVEAVVMRDDDEEDLSDTYWNLMGVDWELREDESIKGLYLSNNKFVQSQKPIKDLSKYEAYREQYERNKRLEEQGKSIPTRGFVTMNNDTLMKEYIEPEKKLEAATAAVSVLNNKEDDGNYLEQYKSSCIFVTDNKDICKYLSGKNYRYIYKERHDKDFEKMYKQFYKKEYQNCGFCGAKNPIVKGRSLVYCVHCHSKLEWYRNKCMDLTRYNASFNQERKVVSMMDIISGFNIHTEYGEGAYDEEDT